MNRVTCVPILETEINFQLRSNLSNSLIESNDENFIGLSNYLQLVQLSLNNTVARFFNIFKLMCGVKL